MEITECFQKVIHELGGTTRLIEKEETEELINKILQSDRVFIGGAGRSGLMGQCFAMRLMHMGISAYVIGDVVTPSINEKDLLILGTGSGETNGIIELARKAKNIGASIGVITQYTESTVGQIADITVKIPDSRAKMEAGFKTIQPMGSLFEQTLLLFYDVVVIKLMEKLGVEETEMFQRHANLE